MEHREIVGAELASPLEPAPRGILVVQPIEVQKSGFNGDGGAAVRPHRDVEASLVELRQQRPLLFDGGLDDECTDCFFVARIVAKGLPKALHCALGIVERARQEVAERHQGLRAFDARGQCDQPLPRLPCRRVATQTFECACETAQCGVVLRVEIQALPELAERFRRVAQVL